MKKRKGHASALRAADARRVVTERVAANGPERVSLRGRTLADADAVAAVCDAVLSLGGVGPGDDAAATPSPTVTLNLAGGNVCGAGAARLAAFLLDPRCRVRELNLVDNPRLGVHLADVADCPPAHAVEHAKRDAAAADGGGCQALASALRSPTCPLTQLNLGGCGVTCAGVSALASALTGEVHPGGSIPATDEDGDARRGSPRLRAINLRSNDVGDAGVVHLARAAARHGSVREIALGNNERAGPDALHALEEALRRNRRTALAAELRDACAGLDAEGVRTEDAPRGSASLRRRGLRDEDAATIAAALRPGGAADSLERLDLRDNELTAFGVDVLARAVRGVAGNASLMHVSVAGNPGARGDGGDAANATSRGDAARATHPDGSEARLARFDDAGSREAGREPKKREKKRTEKPRAPFSAAARALHGVVAVNVLTRCGAGEALRSIGDRGLGDEGAGEVAAAVAASASRARDDARWARVLESVGTQHNEIGPRGVEALAGAFSLLPNLKEWACYANPFGVGGARALARALAAPGRFQRLASLDIGGCGVADDGCVAVAEAIVGHARLRELHLDHNEIGETGGAALLESMRRTVEAISPRRGGVVGVQRVWLHGNPRVPDAVVASVHALAARTAARAEARDGGGPGLEAAPSVEPYEATKAADATCFADAERLARRVYETRSKHPSDANRHVDSSSLFADRVAAHAAATYRHRCPEHFSATRGAAVVAAVVAHETARGAERGTPGGDDAMVVVALGVGTKFMPAPVAAAAAAGGDDAWAKVVHDSHAEVLARRALLRFLNREMRELARAASARDRNETNETHPGRPAAAPDATTSATRVGETFRVLECAGDGRGFRVRGNVTLHLYVSTAPCGAASAESGSNAEAERTRDARTKRSDFERDLDDVAHADAFRDEAVARRHAEGVYASARARRAMRKGSAAESGPHAVAPAPGCVTLRSLREAFGSPGVTLACSDKIAKWQVLGAQGAALSLLVPSPVTFASVVVGRKFDGDALRLGTCCRSAGFPHEALRLPKPKHLAALRTAVRIESDAVREEDDANETRNRAAFIADARRADAGDSDESLTWCRGESAVTRHDGRTGTAVGGGGPVPVAARAWAFRDVSETLRVVRGKRHVLNVDENAKMFSRANSAALKATAETYAAARRALIEGRVPPTSALAEWRGV